MHRGFFDSKKTIYRNNPKWEVLLELKKRIPNIDIICDPSHIGGDSALIKKICQKAFNINAKGLMIEIHLNPNKAKTDSKQQITPNELFEIVSFIKEKNLISSN